MTDLDPLQYTVLKEPYAGLEEPPLEEEQASIIKDGMISVTPPLLGEGEESEPLELREEGLEDIAEDEKEEAPLSEEVNKEDVLVSEEVDKDGVHMSEEVNDVSNVDDSKFTSVDDDDLEFKPKFSRTTSTHVGARPIYDLFAITVSLYQLFIN